LAAGVGCQFGERGDRRHGRPIDAIARHRVIGVAGEHDARGDGDLVADEPVRVAGAVPALVARPDYLPDPTQQPTDAVEHELALDRVRLHDLELARGEGRRLVEDLLRDRDLADVMEHRGELELLAPRRVELELVRDCVDELNDGARVLCRVVVLELDDVGKQHDHPAIGTIQLERLRVPLSAILGEHVEEVDKRRDRQEAKRLVDRREGDHEADRGKDQVHAGRARKAPDDFPYREPVEHEVSHKRPAEIAGKVRRDRQHENPDVGEVELSGIEDTEHENSTDREPGVGEGGEPLLSVPAATNDVRYERQDSGRRNQQRNVGKRTQKEERNEDELFGRSVVARELEPDVERNRVSEQ